MTLDSYLLFLAGTILLVLIPGPDMAYLLARTVAQGRRAGMMAAIGFNLGAYCHLAAAVLGLSALLATSPRVFTAITWVGAAYLVYLGVQALRSSSGPTALALGETTDHRATRTILWQAFLSDVLNPKVGIFFLAFLPQFVPRASPHPTLHLIGLGLTVNMIALLINIPLVFIATAVSARLRQSSRTSAYLTKALGVVFIALGVRLVVG